MSEPMAMSRKLAVALCASAAMLTVSAAAAPAFADACASEAAPSRTISVPKDKSLSFRLDEPATKIVVSQPDSGLVIAKSFYRILGTAAGLLVTVALVFALAQYGELFITLLAVWIGLCNFAARAARNFASYGFQLAGYTVSIVGIPAALNPGSAYPLVVARFTEISLGIGCAALVSRLIGPRELASKLVALVRELMRRADRFAGASYRQGSLHGPIGALDS